MIKIKKILYTLDKVNDFFVNILKYVLAAILSIQILLIFMTAVMRYAFNHPLPWTDELTTYMLVMITFLGGYVASNTGALAKVELIFYGTKLFLSPVIQNQTSSALQMPVKYVWWCLPFTMWLLLITEILGIIHIFVPKQTAEETLPPQEIDA